MKRKINENPSTIILYRKPMTTSKLGGQVVNPFGTDIESIVKCRISHEKASVPVNKEVPVGFSTNLERFIETDYLNPIYEGEIFEYEPLGKSFRIGPVDQLRASGGIYGYNATLMEA